MEILDPGTHIIHPIPVNIIMSGRVMICPSRPGVLFRGTGSNKNENRQEGKQDQDSISSLINQNIRI